jgi:Holliday junction DNA helicase RuvA
MSAASAIWCSAPGARSAGCRRAEAVERDWFRTLTQVQGVGVKVALGILTVLSADDLVQAIAAQDKASLTRADGVGPKLAGRIVSELRDKVGDIALGPAAAAEVNGNGAARDAVSALVNLGYRRIEAFGAVAHAQQRLGGAASIEDLVRDGLKELGS